MPQVADLHGHLRPRRLHHPLSWLPESDRTVHVSMIEQISPEAEAVRVAGLTLARELGHTIVGWGDKPAPAPNTQRMTVAVLSAALPHLRAQIERQVREQIAAEIDRISVVYPSGNRRYSEEVLNDAVRVARGEAQ